MVELSSKVAVSFRLGDAQGLERAKAADLAEIELSPSGFGIHFPRLDADFYVPALLEGFLGSRKWMAARMGLAGGTPQTKADSFRLPSCVRLGECPPHGGSLFGDQMCCRDSGIKRGEHCSVGGGQIQEMAVGDLLRGFRPGRKVRDVVPISQEGEMGSGGLFHSKQKCFGLAKSQSVGRSLSKHPDEAQLGDGAGG